MSAFDPKRTFQVVLQWGVRIGGTKETREVPQAGFIYYDSHRSEMEASTAMRLDLIDDLSSTTFEFNGCFAQSKAT